MTKSLSDKQIFYSQIIEAGDELLERHFPKGKSRERGQALVFYGELLVLLKKRFDLR